MAVLGEGRPLGRVVLALMKLTALKAGYLRTSLFHSSRGLTVPDNLTMCVIQKLGNRDPLWLLACSVETARDETQLTQD